jgi:hypothetical protein
MGAGSQFNSTATGGMLGWNVNNYLLGRESAMFKSVRFSSYVSNSFSPAYVQADSLHRTDFFLKFPKTISTNGVAARA